MTDRNANLAEPFRSTLDGFANAMSRVAPAAPIKRAHELMLTKLAALDPPRITVNPAADQFEAVGSYLIEVARAVDECLQAVGRDVASNAKCNIDLSCFTDNVLNLIEGFSVAECTRAAETVREERAA